MVKRSRFILTRTYISVGRCSMVGEKLRTAIRRSSYRTQEQFGLACNISESLISKFVRKTRRPTEEQKRVMQEILAKGGK